MTQPPWKTHPIKMLLIDDDKNFLTGLKNIMKRKGFEVITADGGSEGLRHAKEDVPDIIICDVMMPGLDGIRLKQILSEDAETVAIPFIFLTAKSQISDRLDGLSCGADDYITKPFNAEELAKRVESILRREEMGHQRGLHEMEASIEKMKHSISSNIGHEFRTPLTVILASLELAVREKFKGRSNSLNWYLENSLSSAQKLSELVEDMMLMNDIDQGSLNITRVQINLHEELNSIVESLSAHYKGKNLNIQIDIESGTNVYAPIPEFERAVTHLLDNAFKFSPRKARICVEVRRNGIGGCLLSVENEGSTIPFELHEQVFNRFYQVQQGNARGFEGLGVGLTITRAVAEACGGNVKVVDSRKGCKILLELPPIPA